MFLRWVLLAASASSVTVYADPVVLKFISLEVSPWGEVEQNTGEMKGAFVEMVKEIDKRVDATLTISLTPFARVDRELESGGHDCTILIPRDEQVVVGGEVVAYHAIGLVAGKETRLPDYNILKGRRVALLRGSSITPRFDADESFTKVYDTDYLISIRKLARSRVDYVAGAIPTIRYLAENNGFADTLGESLKLADVPLQLQCSRKSENLNWLPELNQALQQMKAEGVIDRIKSEYYF